MRLQPLGCPDGTETTRMLADVGGLAEAAAGLCPHWSPSPVVPNSPPLWTHC